MRLGIQLPEVERPVGWVEMRDIATTVEDCGFDSLWMGDHLLYRDDEGTRGPWEAWSTLAAIAEATDRVQLGPLVAATAFHNPVMIAKKAVTIDEISDGRFVLGLGAGWNRVEFDAYGFPYDHRVGRFEESFHVIRTLIDEGEVDFEGRYHTLRSSVLEPKPRPGRPPIMIGSNGSRMLTITLPHVAMWNTWYASYGNTPQGLEELIARIDRACVAVDRDPSSLVKTAAVLVAAPGSVGNLERAKRGNDPAAVGGGSEQIAQQLAGFFEAGADELQLVVDPITAASVEWLAGVREHLET